MKVCVIGSYAKALVMTADRIPVVGETLTGYDFRQTFGGKGSDMAVQAARLGAQVGYIGVVGDDMYGSEFFDLMQSEGIRTSGIRKAAERPTGIGFIIKDKAAHNVIVVDKGANDLFCETDIDRNIQLIREADVVLAQLEISAKTALYALKKAKELGKTTILNPAPAIDLSGYDLGFVDIITPNETEAGIITGKGSEGKTYEEIAKEVLKTGCGNVVMTLGDKGAFIFNSRETYHVKPYKIDVVDSNGAGDSFNASLASALAGNKTLGEAVHYANAVAALCCTKWETIPSYHYKDQVQEFMDTHKEGA